MALTSIRARHLELSDGHGGQTRDINSIILSSLEEKERLVKRSHPNLTPLRLPKNPPFVYSLEFEVLNDWFKTHDLAIDDVPISHFEDGYLIHIPQTPIRKIRLPVNSAIGIFRQDKMAVLLPPKENLSFVQESRLRIFSSHQRRSINLTLFRVKYSAQLLLWRSIISQLDGSWPA